MTGRLTSRVKWDEEAAGSLMLSVFMKTMRKKGGQDRAQEAVGGTASASSKLPKERSHRQTPRMVDVAREAGLSPMTVSRALSQPERVSPHAHARIRKAMLDLGYVQDLTAQSLAKTSSKMVGVVVPTLINPVFAEVVEGITDGLRANSFQVLIASSGASLHREELAVETILGRRPDSVVLTGLMHSDHTRHLLVKSGIFVYEMGSLDGQAIHTGVGSSNYEAAKSLARHLIDRGYREIGFIGGLTDGNDRATSRERGFVDALVEAGRRIDEHQMLRRSPWHYGDGADAMGHLLETYPRMDAVFVSVEMLAVGALLHCQSKGIAVPRQVAMACFDSGELSSLTTPTLTRIRFPRYEVGREIAKLVVHRHEGADIKPVTIDLGFELILGTST